MATLDEYPTWVGCIRDLFATPYWIKDNPARVGQVWREAMASFDVRLDDYASVVAWSVPIYDFLCSGFMPLTPDPSSPEKWPDEAVEALRVWINEGCRKDGTTSIRSGPIIPRPAVRPLRIHLRKNIATMPIAELNVYRMKLDEIQVGDPSPESPWQRLAYVHADWCLHDQEAFLPWQRANLLYLEHLIDFPIPFWDFTSPHAALDGHPESGLPAAFKDLTYIHPLTGDARPNPLRFAAAKDGRSKACAVAGPDVSRVDGSSCRYVHRFPVFLTVGADDREARQSWLNWLNLFRKQVDTALSRQAFSRPEGWGYPWANVPAFTVPQPNSDYVPGAPQTYFDAQLEQAHDNYHGWVGPDMADNAYTAFDPVFWSLHSNIDRIFEAWKRAHLSQTYTANCPLRPFIGPDVRSYNERERRTFRFTSVGDMVKDCRGLGYDYEPMFALPAAVGSPQALITLSSTPAPAPAPAPATATATAPTPSLSIVFDGVRCVHDSYLIDVFLNLPDPQPGDVEDKPDHFVGRSTRLGMGVVDDKGRCVKDGVVRVLDASENARALGLAPGSEVAVSVVVRDLFTGRSVPPEEFRALPGFLPSHAWSGAPKAARPAPTVAEGGGCCSS